MARARSSRAISTIILHGSDARRAAANGGDAEVRRRKAARKQARETAASDRQVKLERRRPLLKEAERLEMELEQWQEEQRAIESSLADPTLYAGGDVAKLREVAKRQDEVTRMLEQTEERWLQIHAELEEIGEL